MLHYTYLVGCGKSKLDHAAPARDLYTGPLFRKSLAFAEKRHLPTTDSLFILSAQHGVVHPDEVLDPYDLHLAELPKAERGAWGCGALHHLLIKLDVRMSDLRGFHFTVYAGAAYVDALRHALDLLGAPKGWKINDPLKGLGIGDRLAWLNTALAGASHL
jgi:hypothetical protein